MPLTKKRQLVEPVLFLHTICCINEGPPADHFASLVL